VLGQVERSDAGPSEEEAWADLLRFGDELCEGAASEAGTGSVSDAIAVQIAYDSALILLARRLGIGCGPEAFDQPQAARSRLEEALISRGYRLKRSSPGGVGAVGLGGALVKASSVGGSLRAALHAELGQHV
jgi:hypothetical protein